MPTCHASRRIGARSAPHSRRIAHVSPGHSHTAHLHDFQCVDSGAIQPGRLSAGVGGIGALTCCDAVERASARQLDPRVLNSGAAIPLLSLQKSV